MLGLGDLAAHLLDDALELGGQFLDLLRADVLARKEDVFVERHADAFPCVVARPGAKPFEPFRERLESSEGGNTGRRAMQALPRRQCTRAAVRSAPGRDRAEARVIGAFD